jgi:hypothetical protein
MSYCNLSSFNPCENLQGYLEDYFQTCGAAELREPTPFFDFLTSAENNMGLQQIVSPGGGKVRNVVLKYQKRYLESEVATNQPNPNCTNTNEPFDCTQTYTIDTYRTFQHGFKWNINEMRDVCQNDRMQFAKEIQRSIDVVMRKIATQITNDAALLIGKWNDNVQNVTGQDRLDLATLKSVASGDINPVLYQTLDLALMQTGYCAQRVIFSGTDLYSYFRQSSVAGCCANEGIDINAIWNNYGIAVYYDKRVASAAGGNSFAWVTQPGALALLTYNQFDGEYVYGGNGTNYEHMLIRDPKTAFPLDLTISDNCGVISVNITGTPKVVGLPNDLYAVGDEQEGVNYFNKIKVVNS